jgi:hypothetical protein
MAIPVALEHLSPSTKALAAINDGNVIALCPQSDSCGHTPETTPDDDRSSFAFWYHP